MLVFGGVLRCFFGGPISTGAQFWSQDEQGKTGHFTACFDVQIGWFQPVFGFTVGGGRWFFNHEIQVLLFTRFTRFWFSTMLSFDPSNFRKDVFSVTLPRETLGSRWF